GAALALAATHLFAGKLPSLDRIPRSRWLSFGGGVSVAYVFVHLLPELGEGAGAVSDLIALGFLERHVYLVAMVGFVAFYGLERVAARSSGGRGERDDDGDERTDDDGDERTGDDGDERTGDIESDAGVFWIHVGSFAAYNVLVGYTLHHRSDVVSLVLFTVAMALHFLVNDYGLRQHHGRRYREVGRWVVSAAVVLGTAFAFVSPLDDALFATVIAFLSGGIVLNVVKEELPDERESRFGAFAVGATVYTALLLLV
ncbi:hypothetical protein ACFQE1_16345, partial [Halobium palmae]